MKLRNNFVTHSTGSETVLIPTADASFSGVVKGNKTVGIILDLLKEDTTEAEIIKKLHDKFSDNTRKIESDVKKVITELRKIGALDE